VTQPTVTLDSASVEAIAQRVNVLVLGNLIELGLENVAERIVELLRTSDDLAPGRDAPRLVDARELAAKLNVSRDTIYEHARELGGERIGNGTRGRLRFDLDRALEAWTSRSISRESQPSQTPVATAPSGHRKRGRLGTSRELLPIRGAADRPKGHEGRA